MTFFFGAWSDSEMGHLVIEVMATKFIVVCGWLLGGSGSGWYGFRSASWYVRLM